MFRNLALCLCLTVIPSGYAFGSFTIDFDTGGNWTAGSGALTSYQTDHVYAESGFVFTGGNALQQTTANVGVPGAPGALGTFAWRLRNEAGVSWTATYATVQPNNDVLNGFSFAVRGWDGSPATNFDVAVSTNSGGTFTSVGTIDNGFLPAGNTFATFSSPLPSVAVTNGQFIVRLSSAGATERIIVDNFAISAVPEPSSALALLGIVGSGFLVRRRRS